MKPDEQRFLEVAIAIGVLDADGRTQVEETMAMLHELKQPIDLEDVLELKSLLTPSQVERVRRAVSDADARGARLETPEPTDLEAPAGVRPQPAPDLPGFEVQRQLGASQVGPIYLTKHVESGRLSTVKLVEACHFPDPGAGQRFVEAAEKLRRVSGPHVVEVIAADLLNATGSSAPLGYVAATAVEGLSLRRRLESAIPHRDMLRIALGMARGLEVLHQLGIVHGGLRPTNVFLEHGRRVRVGGYELGVLLRSARISTQEPGSAAPYRAPELAPGRASKAGDVYSFGVVLYEGYTDMLPEPDPRPLSEILAVIDPAVEKLIMSSLGPEPVRRPKVENLVKVLDPIAGKAMMKQMGG